MKAALYKMSHDDSVLYPLGGRVNEQACQLVLCFAGKERLKQNECYGMLRERFPVATICLCSTAGEILDREVLDDSMTITALAFRHTEIVPESVNVNAFSSSFEAGATLAGKFKPEGLVYLLVLCDGSKVNGSELIRGMNANPAHQGVCITGGLAGDGARFESTLVGLNAPPVEGMIAAIGFYGNKLRVGHGSMGGWETFGLEKTVTRSDHNILFEIDGRNALDLYKRYLGEDAGNLPGSALLFPLSVAIPETGQYVVRTILSVDEASGSMTFAGDIPQGSRVRFMRANFDRLVTAAAEAATNAICGDQFKPEYALLISCVGRKLILQSRVEEEVDSVAEVFGEKTLLSGFYSYGELSPVFSEGSCQLHNQTMTITTFHEME